MKRLFMKYGKLQLKLPFHVVQVYSVILYEPVFPKHNFLQHSTSQCSKLMCCLKTEKMNIQYKKISHLTSKLS